MKGTEGALVRFVPKFDVKELRQKDPQTGNKGRLSKPLTGGNSASGDVHGLQTSVTDSKKIQFKVLSNYVDIHDCPITSELLKIKGPCEKWSNS